MSDQYYDECDRQPDRVHHAVVFIRNKSGAFEEDGQLTKGHHSVFLEHLDENGVWRRWRYSVPLSIERVREMMVGGPWKYDVYRASPASAGISEEEDVLRIRSEMAKSPDRILRGVSVLMCRGGNMIKGDEGIQIDPKTKKWKGSLPDDCQEVHFQWRDGNGWNPQGNSPVYRREEITKVVEDAVRKGPCKFSMYRLVPARTRTARTRTARSANKKESELALLVKSGALKPPVDIEAEFKKKKFNARILVDGTIEFGGKIYPSLSEAGARAKETVVGKPLSTNGWAMWQMRVGKKTVPLPRLNAKQV